MRIHFLKTVDESFISSFQSLGKFTYKLPFINTCLIFSCQKVGKKIETVDCHYLPNMTSNVYLELYSYEQLTREKNYFAITVLTVFK